MSATRPAKRLCIRQVHLLLSGELVLCLVTIFRVCHLHISLEACIFYYYFFLFEEDFCLLEKLNQEIWMSDSTATLLLESTLHSFYRNPLSSPHAASCWRIWENGPSSPYFDHRPAQATSYSTGPLPPQQRWQREHNYFEDPKCQFIPKVLKAGMHRFFFNDLPAQDIIETWI